jgi:tetratricopeptide (TPR) repeat protein
MRSATFLLLSCVVFSVAGCTSDSDMKDPAERFGAIEGTQTEKMRRVLSTIHEEARADPMSYFHLNTRRAEVLEKQLRAADSAEKAGHRYAYAQELLYSGRTKAAIRQLQRLIDEAGLSPHRLSPKEKPVFEQLALSYLRLGEQQNCLDDHAAASCILPIRGAGIHTKPAGSKNAASLYERIALRYPDDLQSRWLLNVAHMTLGSYPEGVGSRARIPNLEPEPGTNIKPFSNVAPTLGVDHNGLSGGLSVSDFNDDGLLDLLVTSYGLDDQMRLYLNDGTGGFVDRTEESGLKGLVSGLNTIHADYNNDGHEDVFVLRGAWLGESGRHPNSLLRNNGDGTFTDVTYEAGLASYHPTQTAAWADFNRDGHVDLFVGNESNVAFSLLSEEGTADSSATSHPSALYLNNGDGTFTDVAEQVGIAVDAFVKGSAWGDVNNNGHPDLYVSVLGGPNRLFVNRGGTSAENWTFEEQAEAAGVQRPFFGFPVWFWDYNNDGHQDLFAASYDMRYFNRSARPVAAEYLGQNPEAEPPRLYRNDGDGTFTDVTAQHDLDKVTFAMGSNYGDLDNDGFLDFYVGTGAPALSAVVPNRMFHNQGGTSFEEVTFAGGFGHIQKGHSVAFNDFDRDGDQDVYAVMGGAVEGDPFPNVLFENPGHGHHWLTLDLVGRTANRSALGARLALSVRRPDGTTRTIHRTVRTGGSFGAQSTQQEIGLGNATQIDTLRIAWPDSAGTTQTLTGLDVDQTLRIEQGKVPEVLSRPPVPFDSSSPNQTGRQPPTKAPAGE